MQKQIEFDVELNIFTINNYEWDTNDINLLEESSFENAKLIINEDNIEIKLNKETTRIQKKSIIKFDWIEKNKARYIFEVNEKVMLVSFKRIYNVLIKFKYLEMETAKSEMIKFNE